MRLIITNGDQAAQRLEGAGVGDKVLPWRDILHEGPVPGGFALEELSQKRADFIAAALGLPVPDVQADFAARDAALRDHGSYDRVELWFEHDLYDQLQLLQLLAFFAEEGRLDGLHLVQASDYISDQAPGTISGLAHQAQAVTPEALALGREAWRIFTSPCPWEFLALLETDTSCLPFLAPALTRLLAEYPDPVRGLGLTEARTVEALHDGTRTAGELFAGVTAQDEARFLADLPYFQRLERLAHVRNPLIEGLPEDEVEAHSSARFQAYPAARLQLTECGTRVAEGRADHALENDIDLWIGGMHLTPATLVRFDRDHGRMIPPN